MLRIFLASSHFSSILQSIYAASTKQEGDFDVMMVDYPPQKKSLTDLIFKTRFIHKWDLELNYATVINDETNLRPGSKKIFIRKVKELPVLKSIYTLLLKRHMKKFLEKYEVKISQDISSIKREKVQLNLLTKTGLNQVLIKLFPEAEINYFEHGNGDYMYYAQNEIKSGNFYCLFSKEFSDYLNLIKNPNYKKVRGYLDGDTFYRAIQQLEKNEVISNPFNFTLNISNRFVFILIENVEMYQVPNLFWKQCMEIYIKKIDTPANYTYILKPHPSQSFDAIEEIEHFFKSRTLNFVLLKDNRTMNIGAELLFYFFYKKTDYVFSLFSSSVYYFTKLYPSTQIKYYQGFQLFKPYTSNAPKQFKEMFSNLEPIVTHVLSKECNNL